MPEHITDQQTLSQLKLRRKDVLLELERLTLAINAFELPQRDKPVDPDHFDEVIAEGTLLYDYKMGLEEKIFFALTRLGAGDAVDIANYIMILDKEVTNKKRVYSRITYTASKMHVNGLINAVVLGRRNVYKLLEESY